MLKHLLAATALVTAGTTALPAASQDLLGAGMTIYMQMGGPPGGPATLPRANGAKDAARHLGANLVEQYSGWQPDVMVQQFREALAASPDCIGIMGHPGVDAFQDLVDEAQGQGIRITVNNTPLTSLQQTYGANGMGYAGVILYDGGYLTAQQMVREGNLQPGDKALVYGLLGQGERGDSERGLKEGLEEAGLDVDYLEISPEVNNDTSLAVPILVAYLEANPDLKAFGTQHGGITGQIARVMEQAGKAPGEITVGGIDLAPSTIDGLEQGYITASLDQQLYLQGFLPVLQCVLSNAYGFAGLTINTGAGTVTPDTIGDLIPLIEAGIR
jgi:simple sugar transport system substrate-binding protein